jgi:hypothetical protein
VIRRPNQGDLFDETAPRYRYTAVASNRLEGAAETLEGGMRSGAKPARTESRNSSGRFRQAERMPCGQFTANAVFFRLGVLAYNLCQGFQLWVLQKEWRRHQVQTLRWRLYQIAGKVVRHAGRVYLKVRESVVELFESIRAQCWQLAIEGET